MSNGPKLTQEQNDRLLSLAAAACDETLTAEQTVELEALLSTGQQAKQTYVAYVQLHAKLMWRYRTGAIAASKQGAADREFDEAATNSVVTPNATAELSVAPSWRRVLVLACAIAATLLIASLLSIYGRSGRNPIAQQSPVSQPPTSQSPGGGSATSVQESPEVRGAFVATLFGSSGPVWHADDQPVNVGDRLAAGTLRLDSGKAELLFDSGAKLVLVAPLEMELRSAKSAHLQHGKLAAHMPPSAVGFELTTPTSRFIDQGTEFGVFTDQDGASELHVFKGQVDAVEDQVGMTTELLERQAMRFTSATESGRRVEFSKDQFDGLATQVTPPIEWPVKDGGNGHFYQLILSDTPITWHQAALDSMALYHQGLPGHLVTVTSAAEDRFLIDQVIDGAPQQGVWMGLTDVLSESRFRWITGEPMGYSNWASSPTQQPDNHREAAWHGGEDYAMYSPIKEGQGWAWADLSVDSIHKEVSAYLVEFEPPVDALRHRSMTMEPFLWAESDGGNGHYYQYVLSFEPRAWSEIRDIASQTTFNGRKGHLVAIETQQEQKFIVDEILRICGVAENVIGLSGSAADGLFWVNGQPLKDLEVGTPYTPTTHLYGEMRWNRDASNWSLRTRAVRVRPERWFGYLVEFPKP